MKKLLALIMCVALLATTGVIFASAAPTTDNFTPAGDYEITWDPDAANKIELDGDLSDWQNAGYSNDEITPDNLVSWVGDADTVDENFQINVYYVSDADFLYIAFYIVDDNFAPSTTQDGYDDGDAFQIAIDFNRELQKILDSDSAGILQKNPKNIFYSFDCVVDDDFVFFRDEKNSNREVISEANGDGVKGAGGATADGWCAEFALSWKMLYEDFAYKSYFDDYSAILDKNNDLQLGITLCYLDRDESGKTISAAGTFKEAPTFTPENNGMSLTLKWTEGVTINCEGILTPEEGEEYVTTDIEGGEDTDPTEETTAEETTAEETTAEETTAEETTAEETTAEAKTEAPKAEKKGCGSVVATGAAVAVLAAAAAAVALKKKD